VSLETLSSRNDISESFSKYQNLKILVQKSAIISADKFSAIHPCRTKSFVWDQRKQLNLQISELKMSASLAPECNEVKE